MTSGQLAPKFFIGQDPANGTDLARPIKRKLHALLKDYIFPVAVLSIAQTEKSVKGATRRRLRRFTLY
jgi:hypothetical protein